jgi:hypothetical protein
MFLRNITQGVLIVFATTSLGLATTWFVRETTLYPEVPLRNDVGSGFASDCGGGPLCTTLSDETGQKDAKRIIPLKITFKPKAQYTDVARENNIQGSVLLKVRLMENGSVGAITPITELPYGLTEQAINAARLIKFEPKRVSGKPVSTVVAFQYSFALY